MIAHKDFGRTGHASTRTIFGAASLARATQEQADATLRVLLDSGVNHIDVAASYGEAEDRIGPWMKEHRERFFLATKTGEREYDAARRQVEQSLERLRVERLDLVQLHNLVQPDEWETAFGNRGALRALIDAREEGLLRFIGITGHGMTVAQMHRKSIDQFDFDSVLLPYNYLLYRDPGYAAEFDQLVAVCRERNIAVQTIKSIARRPWQGERRRSCWYEPLEDEQDISMAVRWVLANPDVFLVTVGDIDVLPRVLGAAESAGETPGRPSDAEMDELIRSRAMQPIFEGTSAIGIGG